jgi:hypothetical protein
MQNETLEAFRDDFRGRSAFRIVLGLMSGDLAVLLDIMEGG